MKGKRKGSEKEAEANRTKEFKSVELYSQKREPQSGGPVSIERGFFSYPRFSDRAAAGRFILNPQLQG